MGSLRPQNSVNSGPSTHRHLSISYAPANWFRKLNHAERKYGMVRVQLQPKHRMRLSQVTYLYPVIFLLTACQVFQGQTHRAEVLIGSGDYDSAIIELTALLEDGETVPSVQSLLARAHRARAALHLQKRNCDAALSDYETSGRITTRLPLNYRLTEACFRQKKQPLPVNLAHILFEIGDVRTHVLKALLYDYVSRSLYREAEPIARTLAARQFWRVSDAKWLAREAERQGIYHAARYWLLKLVYKRPKDAYLLTRTAMVSMAVKDYKMANRFFTRAHQAQPKNRVFFNRWREACKQLKHRDCIARIDSLLEPDVKDRQLRALPRSKR